MRLGLFFLIFVTCASSPAQETCVGLVDKGSDFSREFLRQQAATRSSRCISSVIKHLGNACDTQAVDILAQYLDYVDPATLPGPDGGADVRPSYPAVSALFQIGESATGRLLATIQTSESQKIRENAAKAYMYIYRDDLAKGIRLLRKEQLRSKDSSSRRKLSDALRMLANACEGRTRQEAQACRNARTG